MPEPKTYTWDEIQKSVWKEESMFTSFLCSIQGALVRLSERKLFDDWDAIDLTNDRHESSNQLVEE